MFGYLCGTRASSRQKVFKEQRSNFMLLIWTASLPPSGKCGNHIAMNGHLVLAVCTKFVFTGHALTSRHLTGIRFCC